ncbi:10834_t:CDS:2 [Paraglomus brasilianum]|uniref:10834_t:CDS:1 n=1 Tax=Paraglomus brasilianum TaxID=144538 RepID=A0A9N9D7I8_9GLOM|nr:10834_t:CDS:2 [Paraglomus brasilianum]
MEEEYEEMELENKIENVLVNVEEMGLERRVEKKEGENVLVNIEEGIQEEGIQEEGIQEEGSESRDSSFSYDSMGFYEGTKSQMMI